MYTRKSEIKFLTNISDGFQRIENSFYLVSYKLSRIFNEPARKILNTVFEVGRGPTYLLVYHLSMFCKKMIQRHTKALYKH